MKNMNLFFVNYITEQTKALCIFVQKNYKHKFCNNKNLLLIA